MHDGLGELCSTPPLSLGPTIWHGDHGMAACFTFQTPTQESDINSITGMDEIVEQSKEDGEGAGAEGGGGQ